MIAVSREGPQSLYALSGLYEGLGYDSQQSHWDCPLIIGFHISTWTGFDIEWRQQVHTNGRDYGKVLWLQFHLSTWVCWGLPCPLKVLTGYLISILSSDFGAATSSTKPLPWVHIHLQHFHDPLVSPGAVHKLIKRELPCVRQRKALKTFPSQINTYQQWHCTWDM